MRTRPRFLPLLWLLVVALLLAHNGYLWLGKRVAPDTNILALLPAGQNDPVLQQAFIHMVDTAQQRVVVLIGDKDWAKAVQAADAYSAVIQQHGDVLQTRSDLSDQMQNDWLDAFNHSRLMLLTPAQQALLNSTPPKQWTDTALAGLYGAFGPRLGNWQDDPFSLFSTWVQTRAQETPVRPRDGKLFVESNGRAYVVVLMTLKASAFSMQAQQAAIPVLEQARAAAQAIGPDSEVIQAGVVLHAAAASRQASKEMSTIGAGSLLGIVLLMWFSFRSIRPIGLIALSIGVGCLGALSISWLIFGKIHLLTLVFGASLIGIAQDYGIYFLCARLGSSPEMNSAQLLRKLMPALGLMLLAAIMGYLGLALTPFPGLRQMAVFSGIGLLFAWLTVVCWFPGLVRADSFRITPLAERYSRTLAHWPVFRANRWTLAATCLFIAFSGVGLSRLKASDDIRSLQKPDPQLVADQIKLGKIMDVPTPVQFFLVRGLSVEQLLQKEESLKQKLEPLIAQHIISGYQAVSNWTPSAKSQHNNRALIEQHLLGADGPLVEVARNIGESPAWIADLRNRLENQTALLEPAIFLNSPAGEPWRYLWLGKTGNEYASIVALRGLNNYRDLPTLAALAAPADGIQWVDKVGEISSILKKYRVTMSWTVCAAYVAIFLLLFLRYRRAAWRVIAPPLTASLGTLALLGLIGMPVQLFHILACMLILGLGVDYGIFLQEPSDRHRRFSWLTVGLSAVSALLSFGLLALSTTPPLRAFGLTMLIGMAAVWLIAPIFSAPDIESSL